MPSHYGATGSGGRGGTDERKGLLDLLGAFSQVLDAGRQDLGDRLPQPDPALMSLLEVATMATPMGMVRAAPTALPLRRGIRPQDQATARMEGQAHMRDVQDLPGMSGEHARIDRSRLEPLVESIRRRGFDPDNPIEIGVVPAHRQAMGEPPVTIREGNHRLAAAKELGLDRVPVRIDYIGDAHTEPGAFLPQLLDLLR